MTNLLERVKELNSPVDEALVEQFVKKNDTAAEAKDRYYSIATLEAVVKHYKNELKQILGKDLLEWMQENDQTTFETEDLKVSIKTYVSAKVLDPDLAFAWLTDRQYGDMIKDNLEFPKGELTPEAESKLEELGLSYIKKSGIHPQTLKKIMADRLKDGEELPMDEESDGFKIGYYDECVVKEK